MGWFEPILPPIMNSYPCYASYNEGKTLSIALYWDAKGAVAVE